MPVLPFACVALCPPSPVPVLPFACVALCPPGPVPVLPFACVALCPPSPVPVLPFACVALCPPGPVSVLPFACVALCPPSPVSVSQITLVPSLFAQSCVNPTSFYHFKWLLYTLVYSIQLVSNYHIAGNFCGAKFLWITKNFLFVVKNL